MNLIKILNDRIPLYRIVRLRHRYLFTKENKLRLRYMVGTASMVCVAFVALIGVVSSSIAFVPKHTEVASGDMSLNADLTVASIRATQEFLAESERREQAIVEDVAGPLLFSLDDDYDRISGNVDEEAIENSGPREEVVEIASGHTVAGALQDAGVSGAEAYRAVKAMSKHYDPRSVKAGQAISVHLDTDGEETILSSLNMKLDPTKEVVVQRDDKGRFSADIKEKKVILQTKAANAEIQTSLYGSAARAGIPASIVAEMIRIYSYDVDFQRDIRQGDNVKLLYETYETEDGDFARYGNVLYASLTVDGKEIPVYRYETNDGIVDYFRENGNSLKRVLMQTPIDGARMSSGYGMRRHPVLGYNKMHKGIDFAAPRGTPIYAAGNGVVEKASRYGGYGNYIRIRHKNGLKTAYAHLHKYARGIKSGKRVMQGQVIGYVGTTGRSTGPHLHYEVLQNGRQVNPKSIKSSSGEKLAGNELKDFQEQIDVIKQRYATLSQGLKYAQNTVSD